MAKLRAASGLALLHTKKYKQAAKRFVEVCCVQEEGGGGEGEEGCCNSCSHAPDLSSRRNINQPSPPPFSIHLV